MHRPRITAINIQKITICRAGIHGLASLTRLLHYLIITKWLKKQILKDIEIKLELNCLTAILLILGRSYFKDFLDSCFAIYPMLTVVIILP